MASSKRNPLFDDEPDWINSDKTRAKSRGLRGVLIGATILVVLVLMCGLAYWQSEETEQRRAQAEWEHDLAMQRAVEEHYAAEERRLEADHLQRFVEEGGQVQSIEDLNRAFRLANGDPASNEKRAADFFSDGILRLNNDDLDGAVRAFEQAAKLDPNYAAWFEKMLKQQTKRDRTAPPPREVKRQYPSEPRPQGSGER